jgi:transcription elongation factor GreA
VYVLKALRSRSPAQDQSTGKMPVPRQAAPTSHAGRLSGLFCLGLRGVFFAQCRMPLRRKRIFHIAPPAPTTIYVRPGYNRVLAEQFEALKAKRVELVKDKVEAHSQGDLRENFGFKAAKDAIRAVDRKMTALDRFVARNTFIEVDPATWLTKSTATLQLGHVAVIEKQDVATNRKHRFTFLVTTHGETATDPESGIECLPHNSPLATAILGLAAGAQTKVTLPAGEAILTVRSIRNPTPAELDRLLTTIKPPEIEEEE